MKLRKALDGVCPHKSILMYAEPKVGKTLASDTMPGPILRLNAVSEFDGEASLRGDSDTLSLDIATYTDLYTATKVLGVAFDCDMPRSEEEIKRAVTPFDKAGSVELVEAIREAGVKSLVVDSMVAMQGVIKTHVLQVNTKAQTNGFELYGDLFDITMFHVKRWMSLPLHKCFVTLVENARDEETGREMHFPLFLGKATYGVLPAMVSVITHLTKGKEEWNPETLPDHIDCKGHDRYLQLQLGNNYICGARTPRIDTPEFLPANLEHVLNTLYDVQGDSK